MILEQTELESQLWAYEYMTKELVQDGKRNETFEICGSKRMAGHLVLNLFIVSLRVSVSKSLRLYALEGFIDETVLHTIYERYNI